jgi:DNA replication licensing factor MCM3
VYDKELTTKAGLQLVTRDFLKKFISFIKSQKAPELTDDTLGYTANLYATLRKKAANYDQNKISQPITVRTLETIIRLSTAHAKLRFSKTVELADVDVAVTMLK